MTRYPLFLRLVGLLFLLGAIASASGNPSGTLAAKWDDYRIIVDRNIFLKNRTMAASAKSPAKRSTAKLPNWPIVMMPVYRPEHDIVFVGAIQRHGEYIAFMENTRTGITFRALVGDSMAEGRVAQIALDSVVYESHGRKVRIEMGHGLDGDIPSQGPSPVAASPSDIPSFPNVLNIAPSAKIKGPAILPALSPEMTTTPVVGNTASADERAILERLRQRRQKELKR
jgi:hypothetical protein